MSYGWIFVASNEPSATENDFFLFDNGILPDEKLMLKGLMSSSNS